MTPKRVYELIVALHDGKTVRIGDIIIRESRESYEIIEDVRQGVGTPPCLPMTFETFLFAADSDTEIMADRTVTLSEGLSLLMYHHPSVLVREVGGLTRVCSLNDRRVTVFFFESGPDGLTRCPGIATGCPTVDDMMAGDWKHLTWEEFKGLLKEDAE